MSLALALTFALWARQWGVLIGLQKMKPSTLAILRIRAFTPIATMNTGTVTRPKPTITRTHFLLIPWNAKLFAVFSLRVVRAVSLLTVLPRSLLLPLAVTRVLLVALAPILPIGGSTATTPAATAAAPIIRVCATIFLGNLAFK